MPKIKEGQVWKYESLSEDEQSYLLINKLDYESSIAHVSIFNLLLQGEFFDVGHVPIKIKYLKDSLVNEINIIENIDYEYYCDGYNEWKNSNGGVWGNTLIEVIEAIKKTLVEKDDE